MKKLLFLPLLILLAFIDATQGQGTNPLRINCPASRTNWVCGVASTATVFYPPPTTTAGCPTNAIVTCSPPSGALFPLGNTTVTCRATNSCRESAFCTFTVTVARDNVPPVIQCPTNRIVWLCSTAASSAVVTWPPPVATDNADTSVAVTCSPTSGSIFPLGTSTVTCTATDNCTNRTTCTFTVTVARDTQPPTIDCPGNMNIITCAATGAVVNYPRPTAVDNADFSVEVNCSPASGSVFPVGNTTVTCTATDDCTNRTTCTFTVRVIRDTTPPTITCPTNRVILLCGTAASIPVNFPPPVVSDTVDPSPTVVCVPPSGSSFPPGTNTVDCTATDDCGNTRSCSFTITVLRDITPPTIECPSNMVFNCICPGNAIALDFFKPTVTDDQGPNPTVVCVPPSLVSSPGVHVVTCTATDNCGNSNQCSFTVTFNYDTTPPVLTCPTNMTFWSCSNFAVVNYSVAVTDTCDTAVDLVCTPPSGSLFPLGTTTVTCIAADNCTNRSTCTFTVTVNRDTTPPTITCPTNVVAGICSTCAVSQCVANVPPPIRPTSTGNGLFYGSAVDPDLSRAEAEAAIVSRSEDGFHAVHINTYQPSGEVGIDSVRFGITWVRDDDSAFPHEVTLRTTAAQLQAAEQAQHSLRPVSLSGYRYGPGEIRFGVTYQYDDSGYPWRLILNREDAQFNAESTALAQQGYRAIAISVCVTDEMEPRYSAIYVQDGLVGMEWIAHTGIPEITYEQWFDGWIGLGYGPVSISPYSFETPNGSATYFAGVMARVPNAGAYVGRHGLTEAQFTAENAIWTSPANEFNTTLRPLVVSGYRSWFNGGAKRHVAIWRSSGARAFSSTGISHPSLAAFDNTMRGFMQANAINAATLCVSKDGGIVHHRGYTWAPAEFKQTQPCSRFRIASASKAVTAVAVMKLLEGNYFVGMKNGQLQALTLDTPVFQINSMPNLPAEYGAEAANMTIRQLLQHRAGWGAAVNHFEPLYFDLSVAQAMGRSLPLSRKDRINFMMTPSFWPTPGLPSSVGFANFIVASEYSNFGFSLLAELIEVIANQPYETFVRDNVLLPAGASRTHLGYTARLHALSGPDEVVYTAGNSNPGQSRWYVSDANYNPLDILNPTTQSRVGFGELGPDFPTSAYGRFNVNTIDGAGGWVATSDDLVRLLKSFDSYNPDQPDSDTSLLDWDSMWEMWTNPENITPLLNGYALGWQREVLATPAGDVVVHSHGGNIDGAMSIVARRSDGVCFAAMFSREAGGGAFGPLNSVINAITNWPVCQDGTVVNFPSPIATDNLDSSVSVVCSPPSGSYFPVGIHTVTCTATDDCGNRRTCSFNVTVKADTAPPSIQCPTNRVIWTCSTNGTVVHFPPPTVDDDTDSNPTVVCTPPSGSLFPVGRTVVTCTATDNCSNRSSCTFAVTVNADTIPPVIHCPSDMVIRTCTTNAIARYTVTANDNHDPDVTLVCSPRSGSELPVGVTIVTCTARDGCGNQRTCTFSITVIADTTAPTLACPTNLVVHTLSPSGRVVCYPPPTVSETNTIVICDPPSGSVFPLGTNRVTCTVMDACGNQQMCEFSVVVRLQNLRVLHGAMPQLFWEGDAVLESADEVTGPWLQIQRAQSPYPVSPVGPRRFFRLAPGTGTNPGDCPCGQVGGAGGVWNIDVPSVRIQGAFRLNGQSFPASFLHGANFFLRNADTGDEVYLGLSNNDTFDRRVVPGKYDVIYEHKIGTDVPLNSEALLQQIDLAADQVLNIDVPAVRMTGAFRLDGAVPPASAGETGRILARDERNGAQTELGKLHDQTYGALLIPGAYDVLYSYVGGSVVPVNGLGLLQSGVNIAAAGVLHINVPTVEVSGSFFFDGLTAPDSPGESGSVYLVDPATQGEGFIGVTRGGSYLVNVIPGEYDVVFRSSGTGAVAPANSNARFQRGVTFLQDTTFDVNIPTVRISGGFQVNGQPAPNNVGESALIWLRAGTDRCRLGRTDGGDYEIRIIPGDYDILFESVGSGAVMPANTNTAIGSRSILANTVLNIDIPAVTYSADVRFNGATLLNPPGDDECRIYLEHMASADPVFSGVYPNAGQLVRVVIPGVYQLRYEYRAGTRLPRNQFAPVGNPLPLFANLDTQIDVRSVPLSGNFLLNGGNFSAGPGNNAAIVLRGTGTSNGDSIYLGPTADGSYSTTVIPGQYQPTYDWVFGTEIPRNQQAKIGCQHP